MNPCAYPSSSSAILCCCPHAICAIFLSSKPMTGTTVTVNFCDNQISGRFLTGLAFDVKSSPVPCRDVLSRTSVAQLTLFSTSASVYCELSSANRFGHGTKKRSSRALSVHGEEQRECDASCGGNDVLLFASFGVKRPIHELECVDFWTGRVPALLESNYLTAFNGVCATVKMTAPGQGNLTPQSTHVHYCRRE